MHNEVVFEAPLVAVIRNVNAWISAFSDDSLISRNVRDPVLGFALEIIRFAGKPFNTAEGGTVVCAAQDDSEVLPFRSVARTELDGTAGGIQEHTLPHTTTPNIEIAPDWAQNSWAVCRTDLRELVFRAKRK